MFRVRDAPVIVAPAGTLPATSKASEILRVAPLLLLPINRWSPTPLLAPSE
jgi:hypothetical protein